MKILKESVHEGTNVPKFKTWKHKNTGVRKRSKSNQEVVYYQYIFLKEKFCPSVINFEPDYIDDSLFANNKLNPWFTNALKWNSTEKIVVINGSKVIPMLDHSNSTENVGQPYSSKERFVIIEEFDISERQMITESFLNKLLLKFKLQNQKN